MRTSSPLVRSKALLLILALLITGVSMSACGGSDEAADKSTTTSTPDKKSQDKKTSDKTVTYKGDPNSDFCNSLKAVDNFERSADTRDVKTLYTELLAKAKELQKSAPSEIKDQVAGYVDFMSTVVDKLQKANWDLSALQDNGEIDPKVFSEQMKVLADYSSQVCGIKEAP